MTKSCGIAWQFLFCQSPSSLFPKPLYLFLMFRFIGIKVFDKVCLVSPFLVLPCKFAQHHILLLDGMQLGIVVGDDTGQALSAFTWSIMVLVLIFIVIIVSPATRCATSTTRGSGRDTGLQQNVNNGFAYTAAR